MRQWNTEAMLKMLAHEDADARSMVVSNLMLHGKTAEEALPVLRLALINSEERVRWLAAHALQKFGRELSLEDAERFEQESRHHSEDFALHLLLLGHYFLPATRSETARLARQKHVLWTIEHAVETIADARPLTHLDPSTDGEVYIQAKQFWLKHVEANESNTSILGAAAQFFMLHDRGLSESLLKKAQALEPDNPEWSEQLGHLYALGLNKLSSDARRVGAAQSLEELEKAFACEKEELKRFWLLTRLAKAALEAGQFDKARAYATDLLSLASKPGYLDPNNGQAAIHHGNLLL
jgi:hypothetical protein